MALGERFNMDFNREYDSIHLDGAPSASTSDEDRAEEVTSYTYEIIEGSSDSRYIVPSSMR